jgi:hypothetical protein
MSQYVIEPAPRLYVAIAEGCDACAAAKPAIDKLRSEHTLDLLIILLHLDRHDIDVLGWRPKATPSYALVQGNEVLQEYVGAMTYKQLTKWLREGETK